MKFENVSPESVGISSKRVLDFMKTLDGYGFCTHSILMARGNKIFNEVYYAPFNKDFLHRMYSISKSFVGIAIGMAQDDGLLSIDDKFVEYFPEYENQFKDDELFKETTIKDMLTMRGSQCSGVDWFHTGTDDRTEVYFSTIANKIPGTFFAYDSPGSFMLGVIVEKVTGKPFLEYMKEKALKELGFGDNTYCLQVPGGHSFGDSGVMCTPRDLLIFARFVMDKGCVDGKQYVSREYMEDAVKKQTNTDARGFDSYDGYGYGYQIWMAPKDGFAFIGMGDQLAVCDLESDFIFIINSDNQFLPGTRPVLYHMLYKDIVGMFSTPLEEDIKAYNELLDYTKKAKLFSLKCNGDEALISRINNKKYILNDNPMGIEYVNFRFEGKKGILEYKNEQGEKELVFGLGYNEFSKFPQVGYSDMVATKIAEGNMYACACSADIPEENKLRMKVQIIDKYFGNASFIFVFKDSRVRLEFKSNAEAFLEEYRGVAEGVLE